MRRAKKKRPRPPPDSDSSDSDNDKKPVGRPLKRKKPPPLGEAPDANIKKKGPGRKTKFGRAQFRDEISRVCYAKTKFNITIRPDEKLGKVKKRMISEGQGWTNMSTKELERLQEVLASRRTPPSARSKNKVSAVVHRGSKHTGKTAKSKFVFYLVSVTTSSLFIPLVYFD